MIVDAILAKVFGTKNEREIKGMLPMVAAIGELDQALGVQDQRPAYSSASSS